MNTRKFVSILMTLAAGLLLTGALRAADQSALPEPVRAVYGHYLKIHSDLAGDTLDGVAAEAGAIAKAVNDDGKVFPKEVATEAEAVAKATDLSAARAAFKHLSASLIQYLDTHGAKNAYVEVYCPMAQANWLQTDRTVSNPYLGKMMSGCGVIKN